MKKTTTKSKSPAPATSTTKPASKKKAPASKAKVEAPAPAPAPAAKAAPAAIQAPVSPTPEPTPAPVKAIAPAQVVTKIVARVDVGYGNTLYLRGEGPGLSWSQGVPMECVANDQWEFTLGESSRPVSFKVLVNDMIWCAGPDAVVASGSTATITPEFA